MIIINAIYIFIFWNETQFAYHPIILYYLAGFPSIYVNFVPVADFFLCCDRCLAVAFPTLYRRKARNLLAWSFIATVAVILGGYFWATKWFAYSPKESTTTCGFYMCLVIFLKYPVIMTYVKYVFCGLNFIVASLLLFFMNFRKTSSQTKFISQLNRSVLLITFINIIFAFAPSFLLQIVMDNWKINPFDYLGDFNMVAVYLNILLCVYFFWRVYRKHLVPISVTRVSSTSAQTF